jgi:xanthine dehydrogenase accessory factor
VAAIVAPAGQPIGAQTPEEIALSVLADRGGGAARRRPAAAGAVGAAPAMAKSRLPKWQLGRRHGAAHAPAPLLRRPPIAALVAVARQTVEAAPAPATAAGADTAAAPGNVRGDSARHRLTAILLRRRAG